MSDRPLVFLDVDGVINDVEANRMLNMLTGDLSANARRLGVDVVSVEGRRMAVPVHLPELIQSLSEVAEVWWCTTWRSRANGELTDHLGIGWLPVVDTGGHEIGLAWKQQAVAPLAEAAIASGREVVWIEDFDDDLPNLPGIRFVDTTAVGYLQPGDLHDWAGL